MKVFLLFLFVHASGGAASGEAGPFPSFKDCEAAAHRAAMWAGPFVKSYSLTCKEKA